MELDLRHVAWPLLLLAILAMLTALAVTGALATRAMGGAPELISPQRWTAARLARQGFDNVDLVILDTNDIVLRYEAIKHNHLIYQADDFDRGTLDSNVVRLYLDFPPYLEVQRRAYKQRILRGQQRSHS